MFVLIEIHQRYLGDNFQAYHVLICIYQRTVACTCSITIILERCIPLEKSNVFSEERCKQAEPDQPVLLMMRFRNMYIGRRGRLSRGGNKLVWRGLMQIHLVFRHTRRQCVTIEATCESLLLNLRNSWRRSPVHGSFSTQPGRTKSSTPRRPWRKRNWRLMD